MVLTKQVYKTRINICYCAPVPKLIKPHIKVLSFFAIYCFHKDNLKLQSFYVNSFHDNCKVIFSWELWCLYKFNITRVINANNIYSVIYNFIKGFFDYEPLIWINSIVPSIIDGNPLIIFMSVLYNTYH